MSFFEAKPFTRQSLSRYCSIKPIISRMHSDTGRRWSPASKRNCSTTLRCWFRVDIATFCVLSPSHRELKNSIFKMRPFSLNTRLMVLLLFSSKQKIPMQFLISKYLFFEIRYVEKQWVSLRLQIRHLNVKILNVFIHFRMSQTTELYN